MHSEVLAKVAQSTRTGLRQVRPPLIFQATGSTMSEPHRTIVHPVDGEIKSDGCA